MVGEPVIFDTGVWIEAFHNRISPASSLLKDYVQHGHEVLLTPTIIQEVLQGIRYDHEYHQVKNSFSGFRLLYVPPLEAAIGAADLYRTLRKKGITIRKANDCLIACYAIYHDVALVHHDSDFELISLHTGLRARRS
jgi:predicted nucleic acid-binding protein